MPSKRRQLCGCCGNEAEYIHFEAEHVEYFCETDACLQCLPIMQSDVDLEQLTEQDADE